MKSDPAASSRPAPQRPSWGKRVRRLAFGAATMAGVRPRGWFIPCRYAGETNGAVGYPAVAPLFEAAEGRMRALLAAAAAERETFARFRNAAPPDPRWEQGWRPRLDGVADFLLTRDRAPQRIVEVGSGHSTRFLAAGAQAAEARTGRPIGIDAIDPAPRADLAGLEAVTLHRTVVQRADATLFARLGPGDLLAIDSSHVLMPGSDVDFLVGQVLPALPAGALVAIHDVFLPDPYPPAWAWRGYNEQGAVAALLAGGGWRVVWSSHWAATRLSDAVEGAVGALPRQADAPECALWLERVDPLAKT